MITVPETAVDYTLYGDSVFLITEKKEEDGKTSLTAVRTFVQTGNRIDGRAEILKRPEARRPRRGGRPAQAAIGRGGGDLDRSGVRRFRRSRRATDDIGSAYRDGLDRYFHQATGAVGRRQPADPADRLRAATGPADPAISETVEHGRSTSRPSIPARRQT